MTRYDLTENDDFDREEIATYEEVARLFPRTGRYRPIIMIGEDDQDWFGWKLVFDLTNADAQAPLELDETSWNVECLQLNRIGFEQQFLTQAGGALITVTVFKKIIMTIVETYQASKTWRARRTGLFLCKPGENAGWFNIVQMIMEKSKSIEIALLDGHWERQVLGARRVQRELVRDVDGWDSGTYWGRIPTHSHSTLSGQMVKILLESVRKESLGITLCHQEPIEPPSIDYCHTYYL